MKARWLFACCLVSAFLGKDMAMLDAPNIVGGLVVLALASFAACRP